jgi:hypothetical protein
MKIFIAQFSLALLFLVLSQSVPTFSDVTLSDPSTEAKPSRSISFFKGVWKKKTGKDEIATATDPADEHCSVCFEAMKSERMKKVKLVMLPICKHSFHKPCIRQWFYKRQQLKQNLDCPLCRKDLNSTELDNIIDLELPAKMEKMAVAMNKYY